MPKKLAQASMYDDHQLQWNTPLQHLYLELEKRIQIEIKNLEVSSDFNTQYKILHLREQLHRLLCAVIMKDNMDDYIHLANDPKNNDIDLIDLSNKKLTTLNDLIDYKVRTFTRDVDIGFFSWELRYINPHFIEKCTMRELLNMARGRFSVLFSDLFVGDKKESYYGYHPVLWGKTNSLSHFEESIKENPVCDVVSYTQTRNNFFKEQIVDRHKLYEKNVNISRGPSEPYDKGGPM